MYEDHLTQEEYEMGVYLAHQQYHGYDEEDYISSLSLAESIGAALPEIAIGLLVIGAMCRLFG